MNKINDALKELARELKSLQADRDRYAANSKATTRGVYYKDQQLKILESVYECFLAYAEEVAAETITSSKQNALSKEKIFMLEGICLLHGVHDLDYYMNMGRNRLIDLVMEAWRDGWRQTPTGILYAHEKVESVRFAQKPSFDFKQLLNMANRSR